MDPRFPIRREFLGQGACYLARRATAHGWCSFLELPIEGSRGMPILAAWDESSGSDVSPGCQDLIG